jgi:hypothetical protein
MLTFNVIWTRLKPFRWVYCVNNASQSPNNAALRKHLSHIALVRTGKLTVVLVTDGEEILHLLMKGNTFKEMFLRI